MSHEWAGDGGCQDIHDEAHRKLGGSDSTNVLAWRDAKLEHKRMVSRLLQCRAHLIFCLRAEEKIRFEKHPQTGKTAIVQAGWQPICEKNFMYEQTVSFMLSDEHPGVGRPLKLQEQHKSCFPSSALLDEAAGAALGMWAGGGINGAAPGVAHAAPGSIERSMLIGEISRLLDCFDLHTQAKLLKKHLGLSSRAGLTNEQLDLTAMADFKQGMDMYLASQVRKA